MNLSLSVDGPLDVAATLARYRLWGEDPANRVERDGFVFADVVPLQAGATAPTLLR